MTDYELMHKDQACGFLTIDEDSGRLIAYADNGSGLSPYLGHADLRDMARWWSMRAIPETRTDTRERLRAAGCYTPRQYLTKNLGLSFTDTYWIRPAGSRLRYEDVRYGYDRNASLGGQTEKYWDTDRQAPALYKDCYRYFGQQAVNEAFATMIHTLQKTKIPFTDYLAIVRDDRSVSCECDAFTSDKVEFVSAYEILQSGEAPEVTPAYDRYIAICAQHGISRAVMQEFLDYQTMTDFIISNTDRNLTNFGVLRDTDTMRFLSPAPIFDSGDSMFLRDNKLTPYVREKLSSMPSAGLYGTEKQMMQRVTDRSLVKAGLLPTEKDVRELYLRAGLPERRADFIAKYYAVKVHLFEEFQDGRWPSADSGNGLA